jgi:RNA polymerase sigma factor (TIGR02999 family)
VPEELEKLLPLVRGGSREALDRVVDLAYADLRQRAHWHLRNSSGHLSTTTLVHEMYLRFVRTASLSAEDRTHFMRIASSAMRQIIIDYARSGGAVKRGGDGRFVALEDDQVGRESPVHELILVEQALTHLSGVDARLADLVELRFFGGLSLEEIAEGLGLSTRTLKRDWRKAKALLYQFLSQDSGGR